MDNIDQDDEILSIKRRRLHELEKQEARRGYDSLPHVSLEIADLRKEIEELESKRNQHTNDQLQSSRTVPNSLLEALLSDISLQDTSTREKPAVIDKLQTPSSEASPQPLILPKRTISQKKLRVKLQLFLCHSSGDKDAVYRLYHQLQVDGFRPWLDKENLVPGQDWDFEIVREVRATNVVLVCLSHHSTTREGYFHKEIRIALDTADEKPEGSIYIIPVLLEDCPLPMRLSKWHAVALYEARGYDKLVEALQTRTEQLQAVGLLVPRAELDHRPHQSQTSKPLGKVRTRQPQAESGDGARASIGSARKKRASSNTRRRPNSSTRKVPTTEEATQNGLFSLHQDWRSILRRHTAYLWLMTFCVGIIVYRAVGITWFVNDAFVLLGLIGILLVVNTYKRRGTLFKAIRTIGILYTVTLIVAYAVYYGPQGIKILTVDRFDAVTTLDPINAILLLTVIIVGAWTTLKIIKL